MINAKGLTFILTIAALALTSCSSVTGPSGAGDASSIPVRLVSGIVLLPDQVETDVSELAVVSFAHASKVRADGTFTVLVPDTGVTQTVLVMGSGTTPVLLGQVAPTAVNNVVIDAASTAMALCLLNPFTTMFSSNSLAAMEDLIVEHPDWPHLVNKAGGSIVTSLSSRLDHHLEPGLTQLASQLTIDVLRDYPSGALSIGDPWLEDVQGDSVVCVNSDPIFYAAVFERLGGDTLVTIAGSRRSSVRALPAWPPPVSVVSPTRTYVDLGDGTFDAEFYRGSLRTFDPSTPDGLASTWNTARGITEILALASGVTVWRDPLELGLEETGCGVLGRNVGAADTYGFIDDILLLIEAESDRVAEWLWQDDRPVAADYIETVCPLIRGVSFSTEVLSGGEYRVPFFSTLVTKGPQNADRISQLDGAMTFSGTLSPPDARFDVSPAFAAPGFPFTLISSSVDSDTETADLEFRWDWENDGVWDTEWTSAADAAHAFSEQGAYDVAMQVRDREGLNDSCVHTLNVGGSQENASHVIIVRDETPWGSELPDILVQMLDLMGLTEGFGPSQYEVVGSAEMATFGLTPGEDLVIVQGDQPQTFYNTYAKNQVRFLQFVSDGGTMLWEACDVGWNDGSIEASRIVLPGAVRLREHETWFNYVVLPGAPLVEGLPSQLYGQYASHEGMTNLPEDTTVYVRDDEGNPTLAEFSYGDGWVIMTTQPMEWNMYHNWTSGHVMPHVVSYVLGLPLVEGFGDIVKPGLRGEPTGAGGAIRLTSRAQ